MPCLDDVMLDYEAGMAKILQFTGFGDDPRILAALLEYDVRAEAGTWYTAVMGALTVHTSTDSAAERGEMLDAVEQSPLIANLFRHFDGVF